MIDKSQDSVKNEKLGMVENSDDAQGQESKKIQNSAKQNSMERNQQSSGSSVSVIIVQRTY